MTKRTPGIPVALLLWLGFIGLIVRVWGLDAYCFSPDDLMHLKVASAKSFRQIWASGARLTNAHLMYYLLHYLLNISENPLLLRCISLVPGVGLVFVFFFLGRKASGMFSGLAMACMAVFGNGAILLSQTIRPYSLMMFFLSLALWAVLSYWDERKNRYLCLYVLFMLLAIFSHYPAVIPMTAVGVVSLARAGIRRKGIRTYAKIFLLHLPLLIQVGLVYHFHVSKVLRFASTSGFKPEYVKPYFPETVSGLYENIPSLFEYLFVPSVVPVMIVLAVLGVLVLWWSSRRELAAIVFATFAVGFVMTYVKIYPFGGSRHSVYLFPFVALSIGGSVQWLFDRFLAFLKMRCPAGGMHWVGHHRGTLMGVAVTFLVLSTLALAARYEKYDFRRGLIFLGGYDEFPLTREDYARIMNRLKTGLGKDDAVLVNAQTSYYFLSDPKVRDLEIVSKWLKRMSWEGRNMFISGRWKFGGPVGLMRALREMKPYVALGEESKIWVVNMGWRDLRGGRVVSEVVCKDDICSELSVLGGFVFSLKGKEVLRNPEVDESFAASSM